MRISNLFIPTLREAPADAEIISHQLMLRAGMVRQIATGIYSWLPLGLRVLRKVEQIIREEMDRAGAQEMLMPGVQPAELWQESGRWDQYGPELLRFVDRHEREFCLGPTHEEIITELVRHDIRSYRQLPVNFYQIQTKFRDEIRPRYGIMRAREFLMKDAYSFHLSHASLEQTYNEMFEAYTRIFSRLGLEFRAVEADSGAIGGKTSHEFHVLADSGEDRIAFNNDGSYAANVELTPVVVTETTRAEPSQAMVTVDTPGQHSIDEVATFLKVRPENCVKTLVVEGSEGGLVALVLRGDHELNGVKAEKLPEIAAPLKFADADKISEHIGCAPGSIGPIGLQILTLADQSAASLADFVCGANQDGQHLTGVNWVRDLPEPTVADLRNVVAGDLSPQGEGELRIAKGIEVGHVFQLGEKYSEAMNATCLNEKGKAVTLSMGCYGIGVSRIVAAAIEQNNDDKGIIWPDSMAPFQVVLAPINMHKSERLKEACEALYDQLTDASFEVLFYDGKERPGAMFANLELIGIPHRVVISDKGLDTGLLEYKGRCDDESTKIPADSVITFLREKTTIGSTTRPTRPVG